ncbi:S-layer protein [Pleurocapsa sp. CCALA 161]|uniref:iron uptake porin n=1 Tax=Pleurocapsa sp. CCALA 161 TaxID=2107688 RepID=UPI000D06854D|nr:iron uptake porin [Pleurocapsa sp. CCALA 161]PSB10090.1 S-layer protein [Pleurocapsa sp. CCALA 161]
MLTNNSLLCLRKLFLSFSIAFNFISLFPSVAFASYPSVSELKDVASTDWAYEALQVLIERYGVMTGYPDGTFKGDKPNGMASLRPLTRYEFATALNEVLQQLEELIAEEKISVESEDLSTLQRLRRDFANELVTLESRVDKLEKRTALIEANQFSTTTKLTTLVVSGATGGGFDGDNIVGVTGDEITTDDPNATLFYRTTLAFNTSFNGTDALVTWLEIGSNGIDDNTGGFLEPTFGSVLDYSAKPPVEELGVSRLYYTFSPSERLNLTFGSTLALTDYIDTNSYITPSFLNFSTLALAQNYILFPIQGLGAGAAVEWNPVERIKVKAAYVAASADEPSSDNSSFTPGIFPIGYILYPDGESKGGLFGDPYQGAVEIEFTPVNPVIIRFQYTGGEILGKRFDVVGANFEWAISERVAVFGRYGYGSYNNTVFGDINPNYWMVGISFPDLFVSGVISGVAVAQPFIADEIGDATQTNIEAFYNFPINDNIRITPLVQIITNAANQNSNGAIFSGTLRTVFSF